MSIGWDGEERGIKRGREKRGHTIDHYVDLFYKTHLTTIGRHSRRCGKIELN